jgi:Asp/Glu/hydantoin racemase
MGDGRSGDAAAAGTVKRRRQRRPSTPGSPIDACARREDPADRSSDHLADERVTGPIVVVNPNCTVAVTEAIDVALRPWRMEGGPAIECVTLAEGPPGIETQAQVEQVVQPICRLVRARTDAAAFVIACFSDPGLHAAREATRRPVLGIAECGLLAALTLGERFGILAILKSSMPRHLRYVRQLGLQARFAGELPLGLGVVELADEARTLRRMIEAGGALRDNHGANVLVLGCAGMAQYRRALADAISLPVVDPTQAAVTMAIGAVLQNRGGD